MTDAELKSYLFADRLEQAELEQVMLGHFGRATGEGKDMLYFREGTEDKLRIVYTNKHAIRGIALSPGYPESELQALRHRIHTELVEDQETKVAQVICFAYTRLTGYVRGCLRGIHFQMLPLPPGNTSVGFEHGRHPFVLEVTYQTSVNPMIRFGRIQRATTAVARFLNLLLAS